MFDYTYPVPCPLMDGELIDDGICFDIHSVIHAGAPKYTAPKKAMSKEGFEEICLACPYHRDDAQEYLLWNGLKC